MLTPIVSKAGVLPLGSAVKVRKKCLTVLVGVQFQSCVVSVDGGRAVVASHNGGSRPGEQPVSDRRATVHVWPSKTSDICGRGRVSLS